MVYIIRVYAPHSGKPEEEKENFWNDVFHLMSCIPQNEMVVLVGDMNWHVGSTVIMLAMMGRMDGGFGYGAMNAGGSRIICNTSFIKQESKRVTCSWLC